ncbi:MAG: hypothetical protein R2912_04525 [Eubacteriales bacterium]
MKLLKRIVLNVLILLVLAALVSSFPAASDYEAGDGWIYQDGTLTITENGGLKDFISNSKSAETGEWKYQQSIWM